MHLKRAIEMISEFTVDDDEENIRVTKKILGYCDLVKDDNAVGDLCINAINCLSTYQCISTFLNYASKRQIEGDFVNPLYRY